MPGPRNAMEVFKLLDKSNCRECGEKTCLAFAGAVYQGRRRIDDCPKLDPETCRRFAGDAVDDASAGPQDDRDDQLERMQREIAARDISACAERIGGRFAGGKLTLKVLGKDFSVDTQGKLSADIHVNPWVTIPFLSYILYGKGLNAAGRWVPFRELKGGKERYPLFIKRCEEPIKQVADTYTGLFDDLVHIFNGRQVDRQFRSDISVVLHPLPKLPLMICFWLPDEGMGSSLNVFFDETASENLPIGAVFSLGAGLAQMFQKLALRHGFEEMHYQSKRPN